MIFVDTGAWVAQFSKRDQYYQKGTEIFRKLQKQKARLVTSGPVLYETIIFLTREVSPATAVRAGRQILDWKSLFVLRPDANSKCRSKVKASGIRWRRIRAKLRQPAKPMGCSANFSMSASRRDRAV